MRRLLLLAASAPVLFACGARTELPAPEVMGGAGGAGCPSPSMVVTATFGGGIHHQFVECFAWPDDQTCPSPAAAVSHASPQCAQVDSVDCGPERRGSQCCYLMTETCALT
jgi:hypothetical protein